MQLLSCRRQEAGRRPSLRSGRGCGGCARERLSHARFLAPTFSNLCESGCIYEGY